MCQKTVAAEIKSTNQFIIKGEQSFEGDQEMGKVKAGGSVTAETRKRRDNTSKKWGKEGETMHDKSNPM